MTAHFSAPNDNSDAVVSFHDRVDADDFAGKFGGEVEGRGVVFVVTGADLDKARAAIKAGDGDWRGGSKLAKGAKAADEPPYTTPGPDPVTPPSPPYPKPARRARKSTTRRTTRRSPTR